tara:strand:- start:195 stop:434 length:240 start_codon:yes stop_codon:yes gene_type:complete
VEEQEEYQEVLQIQADLVVLEDTMNLLQQELENNQLIPLEDTEILEDPRHLELTLVLVVVALVALVDPLQVIMDMVGPE